jgi:hypothetical protein
MEVCEPEKVEPEKGEREKAERKRERKKGEKLCATRVKRAKKVVRRCPFLR